jgi:putative glycosyltransferase (TIGR04372 family)
MNSLKCFCFPLKLHSMISRISGRVRPIFVTMLGLLFIPLVIAIRIIRPWIWIRLGYFSASRMGHFVGDIAQYLAEREQGLHPEGTVDLFYFHGAVCNRFFAKMSSHHLRVTRIAEVLYKGNDLLPGGERHSIFPAVATRGSRDICGVLERAPLVLKFSNSEDAQGIDFLESVGLKAGQKFICLVSRDNAYMAGFGGQKKWAYHNFRNSEIGTYKSAVCALIEKGYFVIRMGSLVEHPLDVDDDQFFDYGWSERKCDFLDVWLTANCYFLISTSTGLDDVAIAFKRPVVFVNHLPVGDCRTGSSQYVELFKRLRDRKDDHWIGVREQIARDLIHARSSKTFDDKEVDVIDNTEDEIREAILEMEERVGRKGASRQEDDARQEKFFRLLSTWNRYSDYHGRFRARLSDKFLRDNERWFLE